MAAKRKPAASIGSTGRWSRDENDLILELLKQNPNATADDIHSYFPDKKLKSLKAKIQYLNGGSLASRCAFYLLPSLTQFSRTYFS
jgi:hypothetical protein